MVCKHTEEWLEGLIQDPEKVYEKHLETCAHCQNYKSQLEDFDQEMFKLYKSDCDLNVLNSKIIKKTFPKKKKTLLIASMFLITLIAFNPLLITLAEKLPIFDELIEYFVRDRKIVNAIELGIPVEDYLAENDGYKLYVKDLYLDSLEFKMQYTMLDDKNELPENAVIILSFPDVARDTYQLDFDDSTRWNNFMYNLEKNIDGIESFRVMVVVKIDENELFREEIDMDVSHLKSFKSQTIVLDKEVDVDGIIVDLSEFMIGQTAYQLKYKLNDYGDKTDISMSMDILDDAPRAHYYTSGHRGSDSPIITSLFDFKEPPSDDAAISIKISGYSYEPVTSVGVLERNRLTFEHLNREFYIQLVEKGSSYHKFVIKTSGKIDANAFPEIAFKYEGLWNPWGNHVQTTEYFDLHKIDVEKALGDLNDLDNPDNIKTVVEYVKEEYSKELSYEDLEFKLQMIANGDMMMIETTKIFMVSESEFHVPVNTVLKELEFGIVGEHDYKQLENPIIINVR